MLTPKHIVPVVLVCFTLGFFSLSFGEDQSPSTNQVSPELRKDMANMHQKMADCLRTDQSLSLEECQRKVAKDCPIVAKAEQCSIKQGTGAHGSSWYAPRGQGPMTDPHEMR